MQLIGHRGAAGEAPENTLTGFAHAQSLGLTVVELDVHLSADDVLVVIHDDTVDRTTTGCGAVSGFTVAELGELGIPTLAEVLTQFPGFHYQIEIKHHQPELYAGLCRQLAETIRDAGLAEKVLVISFDRLALEAMCRVAPELPRGLLGGFAELGELETAVGLGCDWISGYVRSFAVEVARAAHARGLKVCCWPCNTEEEVRAALSLDPDAIASDIPCTVRALGLLEVS